MKDKKIQTIPISFEVTDQNDPRFTFVKIYLMHTGLNLNGSIFTKEIVEKCWDSLALTPILGYIQIDENDNLDFDGHKNIIVVKNGEYQLKYIGSAYGCIGENSNPRWEIKKDKFGTEREYLVCDGVLWSGKFDDLKEILDNKEIFKQSMELHQNFTGEYDEFGNFSFSDFKFYGACLLSDKKQEAMSGASVEVKFSLEDFQQEIQSQMELLKLTLNQQQIELSTENFSLDINTQTKGGYDLNKEKFLELLSKYSNLKEEDCKDILTSLETYTLEDLDTKLKELSEAKSEFEMTNEQLMTAVHKSLEMRQVMKTDYWGETYQTSEFRYCDIKDNHIITIDHNWSAYYGLPYSVNGDDIVIDFDNKIEYLPDWRAKESGSAEFTLFKDLVDAEIKFNVEKAELKAKESFTTENAIIKPTETQEYKDLQAKFSLIESENSELQSKFSTINVENAELKTKFSDLEIEKSTLETKVSEFETINAELKTFKETTLTTQRTEQENELFEMFSEKLAEDELKPFKETAKDFSIEQLKEKLFAVVGQKMAQFELTKIKKPKVNIVFDRDNIEIKSTGKPYEDILEQYVASKQS